MEDETDVDSKIDHDSGPSESSSCVNIIPTPDIQTRDQAADASQETSTEAVAAGIDAAYEPSSSSYQVEDDNEQGRGEGDEGKEETAIIGAKKDEDLALPIRERFMQLLRQSGIESGGASSSSGAPNQPADGDADKDHEPNQIPREHVKGAATRRLPPESLCFILVGKNKDYGGIMRGIHLSVVHGEMIPSHPRLVWNTVQITKLVVFDYLDSRWDMEMHAFCFEKITGYAITGEEWYKFVVAHKLNSRDSLFFYKCLNRRICDHYYYVLLFKRWSDGEFMENWKRIHDREFDGNFLGQSSYERMGRY